MKKRIVSAIFASAGMLVLILDGKTAAEGAAEGLRLCLQTVIPCLLPFFVLSNYWMGCLSGISLRILRPLGAFCGIPKGMEGILLTGFLGGYPVGAQCIGQAYRAGSLQKQDAEHLLSFCNNAGPSFLFGMLGPMFPHMGYSWLLWGIHIVSALLVSQWFSHGQPSETLPADSMPVTLPHALLSAVHAMATVCGWVILFRVLLSFLQRWALWMVSSELQTAITGFLEVTNGCCSLSTVASIPIRFTLAAGMLAFGGICVTMQTASVVEGLSLKKYAAGKLMQCAYSICFCLGLFVSPWIPVSAVLITILQKLRKNSRFRQAVRV